MKVKNRGTLLAAIAAMLILLITAHANARAEGDFELTMTDVTASDISTLKGESKILVAINGNADKASIVQVGFTFSGGLKFKSIQYLAGENAPEKGKYVVPPDVSAANREGGLLTGIVSVNESIPLSGSTDLFVLTFAGEPQQTGELIINTETSYVIDGKDQKSISGGSISMTASETGVSAVEAQTELLIRAQDADFYPTPAEVGFKSGINISFTDTVTGSVINAEIDFNEMSKGGNHKGISVEGDEFLITETLISDRGYDVTVSGEGYKTYTVKGYIFTEGEPLRITSDDIAPLVRSKYTQSRNTADFYVYSGEERELKGYLASYNAQGRLLSAASGVLESGGIKSLRLSSGAASYKAFIWDSNMEPAEPDK